MVNQLFGPTFSAIGLLDEENNDLVTFYSLPPNQTPGEIKNWSVDLSEHATLSASLRQDGATHLQRDGLGSRQLYAFFKAAGLDPASTLLIYPLATNGERIGLLAISGPGEEKHWTDDVENLMPGLAHFIAQAMVNSQSPREVVEETELAPENLMVRSGVPAAIVMDKARLQDLEFQLEKLSTELQEAEKKRRQAEINAAAAQKQSRYLAAALRAMQPAANQSGSTETDKDVSHVGSQENSEANIDHMS